MEWSSLRPVSIVVSLALAAGLRVPLVAQADRIDNLRGLTALTVVVENLDRHAESLGLSRERLFTKAQLTLRKAGIRVTDDLGSLLYVRVRTLNMASVGATVFDVSISVEDAVIPARLLNDSVPASRREVTRKSHFSMATVWEKSAIAVSPTTTAADDLLRTLDQALEALANDYLTANPHR